jgi:hypothetical protein
MSRFARMGRQCPFARATLLIQFVRPARAPRPGRHGRLRLASDISGLLRANALKLVEWSHDWATLELREPQHWQLGFRVKAFPQIKG